MPEKPLASLSPAQGAHGEGSRGVLAAPHPLDCARGALSAPKTPLLVIVQRQQVLLMAGVQQSSGAGAGPSSPRRHRPVEEGEEMQEVRTEAVHLAKG